MEGQEMKIQRNEAVRMNEMHVYISSVGECKQRRMKKNKSKGEKEESNDDLF